MTASAPASESAYEQCALDIYLVSETPDVSLEDLELMATAYLIQLVRDVAPRYPTLGLERTTIKAVQKLSDIPTVPVVDLTDPTKRGQVILAYLQDADVAGAAGYHSLTPDGRPYGRVFTRYQGVFVGLRGSSGVHVTGSHETIEAACDPGVNRTRIGPDGKARDFEPGDPVEAQSYTETLPGGQVDLSDFAFATWFDGSGPPPYNHNGNVMVPCQLGPPINGQQQNYIQGEDAQGNPFTDPPGMAAKLAASPNKSHPAARTERRRVQREIRRVEAKGPSTQPAGVAPPAPASEAPEAPASEEPVQVAEEPVQPPVEEWRAFGQQAVDHLVKQGHPADRARDWVDARVDEILRAAEARKGTEPPRHTHAFVTGKMSRLAYDASKGRAAP